MAMAAAYCNGAPSPYPSSFAPGLLQQSTQVCWGAPQQRHLYLPVDYNQAQVLAPSIMPAPETKMSTTRALQAQERPRVFAVRHPDNPEHIIQWMTHAEAKLFFKHKVRATCPACHSNSSTSFCYLKNIRTCKADDLQPRYICSGCRKEFPLFKKPIGNRVDNNNHHKLLPKQTTYSEAARWAPYHIDVAPARLQPMDLQLMQSLGQGTTVSTSSNMHGGYQAQLAHGPSNYWHTQQLIAGAAIGTVGPSAFPSFHAQQAPDTVPALSFSSSDNMVAGASTWGFNEPLPQVRSYGSLFNPESCTYGPSSARTCQHNTIPHLDDQFTAGWAASSLNDMPGSARPDLAQPAIQRPCDNQVIQQFADSTTGLYDGLCLYNIGSMSPLSLPVWPDDGAPSYEAAQGNPATQSPLAHRQASMHFAPSGAYASNVSLASSVPKILHNSVPPATYNNVAQPPGTLQYDAGPPQHRHRQAEGAIEHQMIRMHAPHESLYSKGALECTPLTMQQPRLPTYYRPGLGAPSSPQSEADHHTLAASMRSEAPALDSLQSESDCAAVACLVAELGLDIDTVWADDMGHANHLDIGSPPILRQQASETEPLDASAVAHIDTEWLIMNVGGQEEEGMEYPASVVADESDHEMMSSEVDPPVHNYDVLQLGSSAGSVCDIGHVAENQEQAPVGRGGTEGDAESNMELALLPCMDDHEQQAADEGLASHSCIQQGYSLNPCAFLAEVTRQLEEARASSGDQDDDDEPDDMQLFDLDNM